MHKLGHGQSSTVWLARDIKEQRDVALKIMIFGDEGEDEYSMQKEIVSTVQDTSNLVTYLATFSLRGCRGNHRVVFPVRGPSFKDTVRLQNDFFPGLDLTINKIEFCVGKKKKKRPSAIHTTYFCIR